MAEHWEIQGGLGEAPWKEAGAQGGPVSVAVRAWTLSCLSVSVPSSLNRLTSAPQDCAGVQGDDRKGIDPVPDEREEARGQRLGTTAVGKGLLSKV